MTTPTADRTAPFSATVLGVPRIGPHRELKKVIEAYWAGRTDASEVLSVRDQLSRDARNQLVEAGHDSVPVGVHSLYDQVLDTVQLFGAHTDRHTTDSDGKPLEPIQAYFAAARGNAQVAPLEMTKWFDTNYHYIVPELSAATSFSLHPEPLLAEVREAIADGVPARPVVIGPLTFLLLSKGTDEGFDPLDKLEELLPHYVTLLSRLKTAGAQWVQIDEPILVQDRTDAELDAARRALATLGNATDRPNIVVATYFDDAGESLPVLADAPVEAVALDLVAGTVPEQLPAGFANKTLLAGVVEGRNVWRTDIEAALETLRGLRDQVGSLAVSTSCSLLHVPYALDVEEALLAHDELLIKRLAFAKEKIAEVAALATALAGQPGAEEELIGEALELSRAAKKSFDEDPRVHNTQVQDRVAAITDADATRAPFAERKKAQDAAHPLPPIPTTTIGSFPQTPSLRQARADLRNGAITQAEYEEQMRAEVKNVIELQEDIGLDVLVHGEPERNDMVQYFAEQLDGYAATQLAWVQSYGTRCVRPPILFGDVSRPEPMTVPWSKYAQSLTDRPVKGMLTGPVTMLAWSFVREDIPLATTANQVALAIRDEVVDLEAAGLPIIQVDEPALRELLPLKAADQPAYLDWSVKSFRIATSGVRDETAIHTHMCYSEFGVLLEAIEALDADSTSIEAARSTMELVDDLKQAGGFNLGLGPGIYDIHSPRVPSVEEMAQALRSASEAIAIDVLWANPDCGLKTRKPDESTPSLRNLVAAAHQVRAELTA
ncbi:5-methyltetrahydropteroyltriglutamate--homocysteine S-methyltransferase [Corynebacterium sp. TAE3-ERU12]|uniref:5-methyltetrahydropteroyltriglutamate-- homocysteine S-methyltransferase n=1 Tax=Corynebacterium sp. TAE3-ERU12 TaxID=2849491 RepID=UPI001C43FD7B|nr:5-methyltetrahydropteroyltriglutamate--homocysteine S-methyltransferase [Corynebacterium sp. TAE3-ERU12]MBV7295819.1 5-methyltetrahydropteroyltriglutamate--homocysteine S-methyltransferase [Corynebacterium sp. TAE3-ERU12]